MPRLTRLLVHVEGETEESFVNEVLGPHLRSCGYTSVGARLLGNARQRANRGGARSWEGAKKEIVNHLNEDAGRAVTTMVDYYGLPKSGTSAWPGRATAATLSFEHKAATVEAAIAAEILNAVGSDLVASRFIPNVIMHEFEGLLFSDCSQFAATIGRPEIADRLQAVRDGFASPEEINDSPLTAPSKRIEQLAPEYQKPLFGTIAALDLGLSRIRAACPHFHRWLESLEN